MLQRTVEVNCQPSQLILSTDEGILKHDWRKVLSMLKLVDVDLLLQALWQLLDRGVFPS